MKFDDAEKLNNPLKNKKGVSEKDLFVIEKMKKVSRFPIKE